MKLVLIFLFVFSTNGYAATFDSKQNAQATSECMIEFNLLFANMKMLAKEMATSMGAKNYWFMRKDCVDQDGKRGSAIQVYQTDKAN